MAVMTIRGLDDSIVQALKDKAKQEGTSVNTIIVNTIKEQLGFAKKRRSVAYHDLDKLAGTWSKKDYLEFHKTIADFEKIDEEMWK